MNAGNDEAEPSSGFDFCESAAFKEGEVDGGPGGGVFAADEIPVLSADHDGSQDAFGLVITNQGHYSRKINLTEMIDFTAFF